MTDTFGPEYAAYYDLMYADKEYERECDLIASKLSKFENDQTRTILDLGCGTGNHLLSLARRGFEVTGVDRSDNMLEQARQKAESARIATELHLSDITDLNLGKRFDAVLMMFAVLSYQLSNSDVQQVLGVARQHLRPGGLLILDCWYGPAVLALGMSDRSKVIPHRSGQIIRIASGELHPERHASTVDINVWVMENRAVVSETREEHEVRFFYPLELEFHLEGAGLRLLDLAAFPSGDALSEKTWNALAVAQADGPN